MTAPAATGITSRLIASAEGAPVAARVAWRAKAIPAVISGRFPVPAVVSLTQGADVVDLARVVQVVLDHDGDYPARLFHLVLVGPARPQELLIVEGRDVLAQPAVSLAQPGDDIGDRWPVVEGGFAPPVLPPVPQVAGRVVPGHLGVTERVGVVPVL